MSQAFQVFDVGQINGAADSLFQRNQTIAADDYDGYAARLIELFELLRKCGL